MGGIAPRDERATEAFSPLRTRPGGVATAPMYRTPLE